MYQDVLSTYQAAESYPLLDPNLGHISQKTPCFITAGITHAASILDTSTAESCW